MLTATMQESSKQRCVQASCLLVSLLVSNRHDHDRAKSVYVCDGLTLWCVAETSWLQFACCATVSCVLWLFMRVVDVHVACKLYNVHFISMLH